MLLLSCTLFLAILPHFGMSAEKDLTQIQWDHAVNSRKLLRQALNNSKEMIEADVIMDQNNQRVVMGHNPGQHSDLTLVDFLAEIVHHNTNATNKKGVKLDYKQTEAFQRSFNEHIIVNSTGNGLKNEFNFPLWLNGDIFIGPGVLTSKTVDLLATINSLPRPLTDNITWSLGWTTGDFHPQANQSYTDAHVAQMLTSTKNLSTLTFPVRAVYAARSARQMEDLLKVGTLTVWSAKQDTPLVNVSALSTIIAANRNRIYVDVPDDLARLINSSSAPFTSLGLLALSILLLLVLY